MLVRKTVGAITPIKEIESAGTVFVQNPFSDNISFQCDISLSNVRIDLIDLNGKLLGNWKIPYLSAKDLWQVPAPVNLPNGTYLLTIKSTEKSFSRKLIH